MYVERNGQNIINYTIEKVYKKKYQNINSTESDSSKLRNVIKKIDGNNTKMTDRGAQRSKRGHQNHPKNIGIRTSNVPTSEIIQALRDGRNLESLFQHPHTPTEEASGNVAARISCDVDALEDSFNVDVKNKENSSSSSILTEHNERKSTNSKSSENTKKRKIKSAQADIVKNVRSAGDGAENINEEEDDDEMAELAKLRCTSERTEVVAEREIRRQKKCADYPGLAFGRSIFSSDSMMKFNIIRNELQNIMNNQLRRVRITDSLTSFVLSQKHLEYGFYFRDFLELLSISHFLLPTRLF